MSNQADYSIARSEEGNVIYDAYCDDGDVLYRYEDHREGCGYIDECGEYCSTDFANAVVKLRRFKILKRTRCGVWICPGGGSPDKWVSNSSRKRFAYPTKEEAWVGFMARKKRQYKILLEKIAAVEVLVKLPTPSPKEFAEHKCYQSIAKACYSTRELLYEQL